MKKKSRRQKLNQQTLEFNYHVSRFSGERSGEQAHYWQRRELLFNEQELLAERLRLTIEVRKFNDEMRKWEFSKPTMQALMDYYLTHDFEKDLCPQPPRSAEYIAYLFLSRTERETLLGDLAEEYPVVVARFGLRGAKIYFYKQVLTSIWPLVRKAVIKWGAFGWVVELIRRISS